MGYAVECALKACVVKQFKRHDLPDKNVVDKVYTHSLGDLVRLAGLAPAFKEARESNKALYLNWTIVKDWTESSRYKLDVTEAEAMAIYSACTSRVSGILPWIKSKW